MPISLSSGRTAEDAYRAPRFVSLDDAIEEALWKLIGRLRRDLPQLRRLGPVSAESDASFSSDEIRSLMRDIEYLVIDGSEASAVLTSSLKSGLKRVLVFLEQANATNSIVNAHIE